MYINTWPSNTLQESPFTFLGSVGQREGCSLLSVWPYHTVVRSEVKVWPTGINKDLWWAVLSCEHLQHRLPAYLEGCLKVIYFLSCFCEEQSIVSLISFLSKCQENYHWNEGERKILLFASLLVLKGSIEVLQTHKSLVGVSGRVNRMSDCLLLKSILG